ncbi:hypothetical protein ACVIHI_008772 [Bradyrhizobium sp. USDA 4524]|nr:hypothetical protein [Bradyrhizobium sp. USDA 4538]MCP1906914.1 hypothetical protein [Bradyrhizobium sp. USDA 4537]MCP1985389.1 hypothetical protein [Bradyrhizobium sp. USDA 4539]
MRSVLAGAVSFRGLGACPAFAHNGLSDRLMFAITVLHRDMLAETFPVCGNGCRVICVVGEHSRS